MVKNKSVKKRLFNLGDDLDKLFRLIETINKEDKVIAVSIDPVSAYWRRSAQFLIQIKTRLAL